MYEAIYLSENGEFDASHFLEVWCQHNLFLKLVVDDEDDDGCDI